jgi:outer membrane lipopolysaccharide assembly protein LptE/RlpB
MIKIKKLIPFFLIIIFLNNCGYTPQYALNKNVNFIIDLVEISGDREFNNFLKSRLERYKNDNTINKKVYKLDLKSTFTKNIKSKDSAGLAKEYEIIISVETKIQSESIEAKKLIFEEKFTMKKIDDAFDEKNYERNIKENFSDIILERIIFYLFKL